MSGELWVFSLGRRHTGKSLTGWFQDQHTTALHAPGHQPCPQGSAIRGACLAPSLFPQYSRPAHPDQQGCVFTRDTADQEGSSSLLFNLIRKQWQRGMRKARGQCWNSKTTAMETRLQFTVNSKENANHQGKWENRERKVALEGTYEGLFYYTAHYQIPIFAFSLNCIKAWILSLFNGAQRTAAAPPNYLTTFRNGIFPSIKWIGKGTANLENEYEVLNEKIKGLIQRVILWVNLKIDQTTPFLESWTQQTECFHRTKTWR